MSLRRLGELKDLLLGFDHEPNPVLRSLMKKESNVPQDISTTVIEPPEKIAKIVPAEESVLSLEDVETILEKSGQDLTNEIIENQICPAILEHKNGIKFCALMMSENDSGREKILLHQLILPWMKKYDSNDIPKEVIETISPPGQKVILLSLLQHSRKPDWTVISDLKKLDLQDPEVQKCLARIILEQGPNKDLGLGKQLLALIKSLPRNLDAQIRENWSQAVSLHQSFLSKMCTNELNKIASVD